LDLEVGTHETDEQQAIKERKARLAEEIDVLLGWASMARPGIGLEPSVSTLDDGEFVSLDRWQTKASRRAQAQRLLAEAQRQLTQERLQCRKRCARQGDGSADPRYGCSW
jgi:hypothetical protein